MHLCYFYLGVFIILGLVKFVLVGCFGWVVVSPRELGIHVFLYPPESCLVGCLFLYLGWFLADVFCPELYGPCWPIWHHSTALIWVRVGALSVEASTLEILSNVIQFFFLSTDSLNGASRGCPIRFESPGGVINISRRYFSLMSSNICLISSWSGPSSVFSLIISHLVNPHFVGHFQELWAKYTWAHCTCAPKTNLLTWFIDTL